MTNKTIFGAFEKIDFPEFNLKGLIAKVDTGAYSGALHIDSFENLSNGDVKIVIKNTEFIVDGDKIIKRKVRSASGHTSRRIIVHTKIIINNQEYETNIGLSNRDKMNFPVLIGRRFLRNNKILVDVNKNTEYDRDERITNKWK